MEDNFREHLAEIYLKLEHIKKEMKRDREELYASTMNEIRVLKETNRLLREELKNFEQINNIKKFVNDFMKVFRSVERKWRDME